MAYMKVKEQADNAIKWLSALLSGHYAQATHYMEVIENGKSYFCCWGVLGHILQKRYPGIDAVCHVAKNTETGISIASCWNKNSYAYIGFNSFNGDISPDFYGQDSLQDVNDTTNAGFKRIAKYLIKNAKTNFRPGVAKAIQSHYHEFV